MDFDVAIIGAGPAGSTCAALCAQGGLRTLLLERTMFPREKVCGDCINPNIWPILERLGLSRKILSLPHTVLEEVEFIGLNGAPIRIPLPQSAYPEIAIKRSALDQALLDRARELGAHVVQGQSLVRLDPGWAIHTSAGQYRSRILVAADGRNSTVARLQGLLPPSAKDRVAIQTHVTDPAGFGPKVRLQFRPEGYCGVAPVGDGHLNVCLVSRPANLAALKRWSETTFRIDPAHAWRSITPLQRAPVFPRHGNLLLVGDSARVVEPFTGEGIYYAFRSGQLAAEHLLANDLEGYPAAHAALYRGRLWVNQLAKFAVLNPRAATAFLKIARPFPTLLRGLTAKVTAH